MRAIRCLVAAVLAAGIVTVVAAQQPGGGRGGNDDVNILVFTNVALQDEVKITADQKAKFKPVADKLAEAEKLRPAGGGFGKGDKEKTAEYLEKRKAATDDAKKVGDETLTAEQKKRLKQISIQVAGFTALGDPDAKVEKGKGGFGGFVTEAQKAIQKDVNDALKLNEKQRTAVKEVTDAYNKERRDISTEYGLGFGGFNPKGKEVDKDKQAEGTKKLEEARKKAWTKVEGELDGTQKTAWKGLVGEPFDTAKLRPAPMAKKD